MRQEVQSGDRSWIEPGVALVVALGGAVVALLRRLFSSVTQEQFAEALAGFEERIEKRLEELRADVREHTQSSSISRLDENVRALTSRLADIANHLK